MLTRCYVPDKLSIFPNYLAQWNRNCQTFAGLDDGMVLLNHCVPFPLLLLLLSGCHKKIFAVDFNSKYTPGTFVNVYMTLYHWKAFDCDSCIRYFTD